MESVISSGFRHRHASPFGPVASGVVEPNELIAAEDLLFNNIKLDTSHDVPFIAGMSQDGKTLYVDHEMPLECDGMQLLKALVVHEAVEHCLIRMFGMKYEEAHAIASAAEDACVKANGWSQAAYNKCFDTYGRKIMSRKAYKNIPSDLDTEPYQEEGEERTEKEGGLLDDDNQ